MSGQVSEIVLPQASVAEVQSPSTSTTIASQSKASIERKRQRDSDFGDLPSAKKPINAEPSATQFADLNIDCMAHVFDRLDLIDMFNASDLSAETMAAAQLVYSQRYSNCLLNISGMEKVTSIEFEDSVMTVSSVPTCLKFLRAFGDSIKKLQLEYLTDKQLLGKWMEVKELIHEKCAKQLINLKLVNCEGELFAGVRNPLENVKNLRISCSHLGECIALDKWFPAIEQLELMHNDGCPQIKSYFPYLCYLAMDVCLKTVDIETMLKSAPQLHTLRLWGGIDASLLQFISDHLPNLTELQLNGFHLATEQEAIIRFKSVEKLRIATGFLGWLPDDIPFEFEQLKELRLVADMLGSDWIHFALQQHQLEKLQIDTIWEPEIGDDQLIEMATTHSQLKELDIVADVTSLGLTRFLAQHKSLQKIRITKYDDIQYDDLAKAAGTKWQLSSDRRSMTFERKN